MTEVGGGVRAFLALEIPAAQREAIAEGQQRLRSSLPPARWVRARNQHLTLKFLGEVAGEGLHALAGDLRPALAPLPVVTVEMTGAGFFPDRRRPRVAWIGGRAEGAVEVVAAVDRVAAEHGFERQSRPWALHVTQARLRRAWPSGAVRAFLRWGGELALEPFVCAEVVLFESQLTPDGAIYTALERFELGCKVS